MLTGQQLFRSSGSQTRRPSYGSIEDGSDFLPDRRRGCGRSCRTARLRGGLRPSGAEERRDDGRRREPGFRQLRAGGRLDRRPRTWERAAPLRLERLQQRSQARGPQHGRAHAPLPPGAGPALVEHLRARHRSRPRQPTLVKTIDGKTLSAKAGYSRPHTLHCGPDGVFLTCVGGAEGDDDGPGGIALLDHETFDVLRAWETDRGPQHFHYDAWWHLNQNVLISSEWGSPSMIEDGIVPELLLGQKYGHAIHFWDLAAGKHVQRVDLGAQHQMALELRPSHDPEATWGFVGVVISTEDLSGSVWRWFRDGDDWKAEKVITIPAEPADPDLLPPALKPFAAVPPLITDIDLSVDDRFLYVSCWGTGEMKQFDVSDPANPKQAGSVRLGGIVNRTPHPARADMPLSGGPQMVEVSRDGKRVYFTNSLYGAWDDQFYPDGVGAWMAKLDTDPDGGLSIDERFFPHSEEFRGLRVHQIRLQGGDASSDSYCYS